MKALFATSRESLGSRRLMRGLREENFDIGRYRVRRIMKSLGLVVKHKRKYRITTDSNHNLPVAENILDRQFNPAGPNRVWGTDISYLRTQEGWVYLAVVIDLYSRRVVGWSMDKNIDRHLVIRALMMAVWKRQPKASVLVHSDQGSQYSSADYVAFLRANNLKPSMSRRGNCHDNALAESFFATFKKRVTQRKIYSTRDDARTEMFYNPIKRHSHTGGISPVKFEEDYFSRLGSV